VLARGSDAPQDRMSKGQVSLSKASYRIGDMTGEERCSRYCSRTSVCAMYTILEIGVVLFVCINDWPNQYHLDVVVLHFETIWTVHEGDTSDDLK
jgi:hypothetical protein